VYDYYNSVVKLKKNIINLEKLGFNKIRTIYIYDKDINRIIITRFITERKYSIKTFYYSTTRKTKILFSYRIRHPLLWIRNSGCRIREIYSFIWKFYLL
jgi:hypothetical protein